MERLVSNTHFAKLTGLLAGCLTLSSTAFAQSNNVEEVIVIGRQEFLEREFTATRTGANVDPAKLMTQVPGGGANNNGPLRPNLKFLL